MWSFHRLKTIFTDMPEGTSSLVNSVIVNLSHYVHKAVKFIFPRQKHVLACLASDILVGETVWRDTIGEQF